MDTEFTFYIEGMGEEKALELFNLIELFAEKNNLFLGGSFITKTREDWEKCQSVLLEQLKTTEDSVGQ